MERGGGGGETSRGAWLVRTAVATALLMGPAVALAALRFPSEPEIAWGVGLVAWVLLVVFWLSKKVSAIWDRYVARKFIHFTTGGLVAVIAPYVFREPTVPFAGAMFMALITVVPRLRGEVFDWYQLRDSFGDTYFCLTWGTVFLLLWDVNLNAAIASSLFMAFGDGVTGLVRRNFVRERKKTLHGTAAMIPTCALIGWLYAGPAGVLAGLVASAIELLPKVDDNLTVPLVSAAIMYALSSTGWFAPALGVLTPGA